MALDASGRGPNAIAVRARWRDERGTLSTAVAQHRDAALVLGTTRGSVVRVTAAVALAYGAEDRYEAGARAALAVLPTLSMDAPLGANWTLHLGGGGSTLGTPGFGIARASLGEAGIAYTDRRRLRAELLAHTESDNAPAAVNRGVAAAVGWEIAPRLSLRAWSLRDGDLFDAAGAAPYPGGPPRTITIGERFDRDVLWLTWDAPTRFDLLLRNGALEGNVRVPLGARYALTVGTYRRPDTTSAVSLGIVAR